MCAYACGVTVIYLLMLMSSICIASASASAQEASSSQQQRIPLPDIYYANVIAPLLPVVEEITRLPVPLNHELPVVYLAPREYIEKLYCGPKTAYCGVAAVTDEQTGEITLSSGLSPGNLLGISVIFHELVHWAQIKNHLFDDEADCAHWAKREMHAYTAQSRFLESHGHRGFSVPDLLSSCR